MLSCAFRITASSAPVSSTSALSNRKSWGLVRAMNASVSAACPCHSWHQSCCANDCAQVCARAAQNICQSGSCWLGATQVLLPAGMESSKWEARAFLQSIALTPLHAVNSNLMYSMCHGSDFTSGPWSCMQDVISCFLLATAVIFPSEFVAIYVVFSPDTECVCLGPCLQLYTQLHAQSCACSS